MKVLVTGAGGFVGSHVVEQILTLTDWDVIAVDSFRGAQNGSIDTLLQALGEVYGDARGEVHELAHNLTVPFSLQQMSRMGEVDAIVNVASLCQVDQSIQDPAGFISNNVNLMLTMLELARLVKPRIFIHMSTDEVYGPSDSCAPTDHQPSSPYAASKAAQEDISHSYRRTFGVPVTVVNSANMYGERQSQLAFIPRVVRWIEDNKSIPVHYVNGAPGGRHYTYVKNVARHIVDQLRVASLGGVVPARVILPGQQYVDNETLVHRVSEIIGKRAIVHAVQAESVRPGYDPKYAKMNGYPWTPEISFFDGLNNAVKELMQNG